MKWKDVTNEIAAGFNSRSVVRFKHTKLVLHEAKDFLEKYPHRINTLEWLCEEEAPTPEAGRWVRVEDGLPEEGAAVLAIISRKGGGFFQPFSTEYKGNGEWGNEWDDENNIEDYSDRISHWQPLPSPPHQ